MKKNRHDDDIVGEILNGLDRAEEGENFLFTLDRVVDLVNTVVARRHLTREKAALLIYQTLVAHCAMEMKGPFEEPIKTGVVNYRKEHHSSDDEPDAPVIPGPETKQ